LTGIFFDKKRFYFLSFVNFASFLLALFVVTIFVQVKRKQEQDIEAARKRIAEREKDAVGLETLVAEIIKDVMKSGKEEENEDKNK